MHQPRISIIIPTLNEEAFIGPTLKHLSIFNSDIEIIVVDGHSLDRTVEIASEHANCYLSERGRGNQMNYGAQKAKSDILWFLHADCQPGAGSDQTILDTLENKLIVGGAFLYSFNENTLPFRFFSAYSNLKNRLKQKIYGDMGIFVRREIFERIGGFKEALLMEDFEFGARLKKAGKIKILNPKIITSTRDWRTEGIVRKTVKDTIIKLAYQVGVDNRQLYNWYYRINKK